MQRQEDPFDYDLVTLDPDEQQAWWAGLTPEERQAYLYEARHGRPPTWLGRLAFGLGQAQEMAEILFADICDDVDASISTIRDRDERYGNIEDASPWWVPIVADLIVAYWSNRTRFYCSGAPYGSPKRPLWRECWQALVHVASHARRQNPGEIPPF